MAGIEDFQERQDAKRERLEGAAANAHQRAADHMNRSKQYVAGIPFGQPILVGHHSEGRHRNALRKSDNAMRRALDENEKAKHLDGRAAGVGEAGISSDDPEAVNKLRDKLAEMEASRERMKAENRIVRSKKLSDQQKRDQLGAAAHLLEPDYAGRLGHPSYELQNLGGNIRRVKLRIEDLLRIAAAGDHDDIKTDQVHIYEDRDENRICVKFADRPDKDGCRWMRSMGWNFNRRLGYVWTRRINVGGWHRATMVAEHFTEGNTE